MEFKDTSSNKILGIQWNAKSDKFSFTTTANEIKNDFTKREVFSIIAKLLDPAGWLDPIIINTKLLIQQI